MRNWSSNSRALLDHLGEIPKQEAKDLSLAMSSVSERVLGMLWLCKDDVLCYATSFREEIAALMKAGAKPTKRQILKCVMSLFDPLGLLAAFLVHGKILMQNVWRTGIKWDECVNDQIYDMWAKWVELFDRVGEIRVPRCYFPNASTRLYDSLEAQVFVDASEAAYSAVVYFRVVDPDGTVQCALVAAKTKVAPLKYVSIPRLELNAAVLGVRLFSFVLESHAIPIKRCLFWSDSATTLAWIRSEHRRYRPFVACRVGEILSTTSESAWRWVPSALNVADEATKWGKGPCFETSSRWFNGPEFLYQPEIQWPKPKSPVITTDEEWRPCFLHREVTMLRTPITFERFSNWSRLLQTTAYIKRFGAVLKRSGGDSTLRRQILGHEELRKAEVLVWMLVQSEVYPDELAILSRNKLLTVDKQISLEKSSPLYKLTPVEFCESTVASVRRK